MIVAHGMYHGVGMQDLRPLTFYCNLYAHLRGKVNFSFPGPHYFLCRCAVLLVHGAQYFVSVRFIVVPHVCAFDFLFSRSWCSSSFYTGASSNSSFLSSSPVASIIFFILIVGSL